MRVHFRTLNPMQVKDLTIDELRLLIQETVTETIQALLFDPDEGKQIKLEVQQQLLDSLRRTQAGERGIPAEEVARKLGLNW
jgi:RNA 3'-terminal phosphate cyclase